MSTLVAPPDQQVVPVLAAGEARRLLGHPVMLTGWGLWLLTVISTLVGDPRPLDVFEQVGSSLSWVPGLFAILAAYLVATREQRAGTLDVLGSLPAREPERVRALCLASLVPGLVALVLNVALTALLRARDMFYVDPAWGHVVQGPLTVVGACLLGVLVAVWLRAPVAPALTVVGMVALHVAFQDKEPGVLFGPTVFWAAWGPTGGELWDGFKAGSPGWHAVYVAGLCGLAATAALLRVSPRPSRTVALGLVSLAVTMTAALLQLP